MLTIVPTPIGNLKDITLRSIESLESCDGIICEDTRRSSQLLNALNIKKPLYILNDFNEKTNFPKIIERLRAGENLCLISDAGTPLISDPGFKLVREVLKEKIKLDSLPGPSSILTALTLSGLPPNNFFFLGYPPDKPGHRKSLWGKILAIAAQNPSTFILFISPFKLLKTLTEMKESLGDVEICLAKELTKIHQQVDNKKIGQWLEQFKRTKPKGEFVCLIYLNSD